MKSISVFFNPAVFRSICATASIHLALENLTEEVSRQYPILFVTNRSLRAEILRIFDSTFAITHALEAIAITIAGLGVISTLITLILERRREFTLLSFLGATRSQIRRMITLEAITIWEP